MFLKVINNNSIMFGILVFGDSISFGRGESPCIGWSGRLKKYSKSSTAMLGAFKCKKGHGSRVKCETCKYCFEGKGNVIFQVH